MNKYYCNFFSTLAVNTKLVYYNQIAMDAGINKPNKVSLGNLEEPKDIMQPLNSEGVVPLSSYAQSMPQFLLEDFVIKVGKQNVIISRMDETTYTVTVGDVFFGTVTRHTGTYSTAWFSKNNISESLVAIIGGRITEHEIANGVSNFTGGRLSNDPAERQINSKEKPQAVPFEFRYESFDKDLAMIKAKLNNVVSG